MRLTEHTGYLKRGDWQRDEEGGKKLVVARLFESREEATVNELIYHLLLAKIDRAFRKDKKKTVYEHGFEILPGDTVLSEHLSRPNEITVLLSAYGGLTPDMAHVMQNRQVMEFKGIVKADFNAYIDSLIRNLAARKAELEKHLKGLQKEMRDRDFDISLTYIDVLEHLNALKRLPREAYGNVGEQGLDSLVKCVSMVKRKKFGWRGTNLISVAHVVDTRYQYAELEQLESPEKVMEVFTSDVPYGLLSNPVADGLLRVIRAENPQALLVNEASFDRINTGVRMSLELRDRIRNAAVP
jgi:hypothetical protein